MISKGTVTAVFEGMVRVTSDEGTGTAPIKCSYAVSVGQRVIYAAWPDGDGAVLEVIA